MNRPILTMNKITFILSLSLWIITVNSCEKGTPEDENTPPIIELIQPRESTDIYAGDPILFEVNISDPGGDHLSVEFFSADSLFIHKLSTALGAGTEYTLTGVKK